MAVALIRETVTAWSYNKRLLHSPPEDKQNIRAVLYVDKSKSDQFPTEMMVTKLALSGSRDDGQLPSFKNLAVFESHSA